MKTGKKRKFYQQYITKEYVKNPQQFILLVIILGLLSFFLAFGMVITYGFGMGTSNLSAKLGADIMVVPEGYTETEEKILLSGEPSLFYMGKDVYSTIKNNVNGIDRITYEIYVTSLSQSCCSAMVQLIGIDPKKDFTIGSWLEENNNGIQNINQLSGNDIVIGSSLDANVGEELQFFKKKYKIVGRLKKTGTGIDRSVYFNIPTAKILKEDYGNATNTKITEEGGISNVLIQAKSGQDIDELNLNIYEVTKDLSDSTNTIVSESIVSDVSDSMKKIAYLAIGSIIIFWLITIFLIGMIFHGINREHKKEYGILRSIGASRKDISNIVVWRTLIVSMFGGASGIFLGLGIGIIFLRVFAHQLNLPFVVPELWQLAVIVVISFLIVISIGPISSFQTTRKILKDETYLLIREGEA